MVMSIVPSPEISKYRSHPIMMAVVRQARNAVRVFRGSRTGKLPSLILLALFPLADPAGGSSAGIGDEESASRVGEEYVIERSEVNASLWKLFVFFPLTYPHASLKLQPSLGTWAAKMMHGETWGK
jgi:hypothetical protein